MFGKALQYHRYPIILSSVGGTEILSGFVIVRMSGNGRAQIKFSRCLAVSRSRSNPGENSLKLVPAAEGSYAVSSALNK